jgi:hypothetical protein
MGFANHDHEEKAADKSTGPMTKEAMAASTKPLLRTSTRRVRHIQTQKNGFSQGFQRVIDFRSGPG